MGHFDEFGSDEELKNWIIYAAHINYLAKAYREAKDFSYINSNSTLLDKLKIKQEELNNIQSKIKKYETDIKDLIIENEKLEKKNKRLKAEVEKLKTDKLEINSLRDFIFNQESKYNNISINELSIDNIINIINDKKLLIIGGNENWIKKMKEKLKDCTFIPPGVNFDKKALYNRETIINTDCIGHKTYYKIIENIGKMKSFKFFSGNINIELSLRKIYELI